MGSTSMSVKIDEVFIESIFNNSIFAKPIVRCTNVYKLHELSKRIIQSLSSSSITSYRYRPPISLQLKTIFVPAGIPTNFGLPQLQRKI